MTIARRISRRAFDADGKPRTPKTLSELLAAHERLILIQALQLNGFSRQLTALSLGITPNQLWRRMTILKIDFAALPRNAPGRPRKKLVDT